MITINNKASVTLLLYLFSIWACSSIISPTVEDNEEHKACIMVVPDIQNYTHLEERFEYLEAISDYYKDNIASFDALLQVGDLTNNNLTWQYENAFTYFFSKFDKSDQVVFCLGNHDYGSNGSSDVRLSNLPVYMAPSYDLKMDGARWENYVKFISLGGIKYGVLVLEFCTRNETLNWANDILKLYSSTPFIILMHVFLDQNGELFDSSNPNIENKGSSHKDYNMSGDYKNDSREIFDSIIYYNPNVKMVFCGHCLTPNYINVHSESNVEKRHVYMIEVNYQHYSNGGEGCVGILEISNNDYRIRSFSTYHKTFTDKSIVFGDGKKEW